MSSLRILWAFAAVSGFVDYAVAQATEPYYAQTMTTAAGFCPRGWAEMNGQRLAISENTALFQLLGTAYGGNGVDTFALPLAKPLFTADGVPLRQCISLGGIFPSQN
jgi:microcystin-dependent protein